MNITIDRGLLVEAVGILRLDAELHSTKIILVERLLSDALKDNPWQGNGQKQETQLLGILADLEFSQSSLCFDPEANIKEAILKLRSLLCLAADEVMNENIS